METSQVGKQSADKEVHKDSQRYEKVCKYCDKAFESLKNHEEHVENCKKLFCEKCKTKLKHQRNIQIMQDHVQIENLCVSHVIRN